MDKHHSLILWFKDVGMEDVPLAGGKNAALGEMVSNLIPLGVNVPDRFLDIFDGMSIGSNDLTQLTLGKEGIESISLNPDSVIKTLEVIAEKEEKI